MLRNAAITVVVVDSPDTWTFPYHLSLSGPPGKESCIAYQSMAHPRIARAYPPSMTAR